MDGTELFFAIKGLVSLAAVILLVYHMSTMRRFVRRAQRMRYVSLLGFATVVAGASARQMNDHEHIHIENVAALIVSFFLLLTAIVSIHDEKVGRR